MTIFIRNNIVKPKTSLYIESILKISDITFKMYCRLRCAAIHVNGKILQSVQLRFLKKHSSLVFVTTTSLSFLISLRIFNELLPFFIRSSKNNNFWPATFNILKILYRTWKLEEQRVYLQPNSLQTFLLCRENFVFLFTHELPIQLID